MTVRHASLPFLGLLLVLGTAANAAGPQASVKRLLANPPAAKPNAAHVYDLNVQMTDYHLYNPVTGLNDAVKLRTYWMTSGGGRPDSPLVGPTIEAKPGDTVLLNLHNKLPGPPHCDRGPDHNIPKCFDITNFHTHGLWVTPSGNGDNVMLEINPTEGKDFKFEIPKEHPAGTFWYHSHVHGSTAIQVASGMSGALILRGDRKPTMTANGDIDTLLVPMAPKERILLFQQISYACGRNGTQVIWDCTGKTGTIDGYDQIGGSKWSASGRFTSINGQVLPEFPGAVTGKTERWRMIHGGIANTLNVFIRMAKAGAKLPDKLTPDEAGTWVADNCTGDVVHQFAIASDGLTRSRVVERGATKSTTMQPGYREDVLLTFPKPGMYCVIDTAAPVGVGQVPENRALLGIVNAAPGHNIADQRAFVEGQLSTSATAVYASDVAAKVKADLANGMRLSMFTPHKDLRGETNVGHQELAFDMDDGFEIATKFDGSNRRAYDGTMSRTLMMGTTDEWKMTSIVGNHPYHIHVNPFQVVKILDKAGNDVSETGEANDTQYADLKGEWKDTLFVKQGYTVVTRTHYDRFDGVFVLHCHILDHEDKGMMEKIQICKPGGLCEKGGGTMNGMHH